jgi:cytochrome c553
MVLSSSRRVVFSRRAYFGVCAMVAMVGCALVSPAVLSQETRAQVLVKQALSMPASQNAGERLYLSLCVRCHGPEAHGEAATATPALSGQRADYLVKQLADMAEAYRPAAEMHRLIAREELTSPKSLRNVASYLSFLPPLRNPQTGDGGELARGQQLYEAACFQCHGARADAHEQGIVPILRSQHYAYLLMQMRQMPMNHGTALSEETMERFEDYSLKDLSALSDYISRIPARPAGAAVR